MPEDLRSRLLHYIEWLPQSSTFQYSTTTRYERPQISDFGRSISTPPIRYETVLNIRLETPSLYLVGSLIPIVQSPRVIVDQVCVDEEGKVCVECILLDGSEQIRSKIIGSDKPDNIPFEIWRRMSSFAREYITRGEE